MKERVFGQQMLELRQKVELLADEKRSEVNALTEELNYARGQLDSEIIT